MQKALVNEQSNENSLKLNQEITGKLSQSGMTGFEEEIVKLIYKVSISDCV